MNLYVGLAIQAALVLAQGINVFTPSWTTDQHAFVATALASINALVGTYQHMSGQVSFNQPTPPSPPPPQPRV